MFLVECLVFRLKDVTTALVECHVHRGATPLPSNIVTPFDQRACRRIAESVRGPIASSTLYPEDYGLLNLRPPPSGVVKGACLRETAFVEMSKDGETQTLRHTALNVRFRGDRPFAPTAGKGDS